MKIITIRLLFLLLGPITGALLPATGLAADFTVNSDADVVDDIAGDGICATAAGFCTVRAAVQEANALAGVDTISIPDGTYYLAGAAGEDLSAEGDLDILEDLHIVGSSKTQTVIDATSIQTVDRVFQVTPGANLTLSKMTLQGGGVLTDGGAILHDGNILTVNELVFNANTSDRGGAIYSVGSEVIIKNSQFIDNAASNGGAIHSTAGTVSINNSSFQLNQSTIAGGAIYHSTSLSLSNVTMDGNTSSLDGGAVYTQSGGTLSGIQLYIKNNTISNINGHGAGIYAGVDSNLNLSITSLANNALNAGGNSQGGGLYFNGNSAYLENVTVSGNAADVGGGIYTKSGIITLQNSTLAYNSADNLNLDVLASASVRNTIIASPVSGANCSGNGSLTSLGYNISDDAACNLGATSDQLNTNPQLALLDAVSLTHVLTGVSNPAQDRGDNLSCPDMDGAYLMRTDGACDIGAREVGAVMVQPGILGFSLDTISINENTGILVLHVSRNAGSDLSVSVDIATADGTAVGGEDYIPASGTLTWAHGDSTDKTITIAVVDDVDFEVDETFTVSLVKPVGGAQLGVLATNTVTIISDDSEPAPEILPPPEEDTTPVNAEICAPGSYNNQGTDKCTTQRPRGGGGSADPLSLIFALLGYLLWHRRFIDHR